MKTITPQQLEGILEVIISDKEKMAKSLKEHFVGVAQDDVLAEIRKRLGNEWVLKKEQPIKFTKEDINAVANSRFYRKTGIKLLMLLAISILGLAMLTTTLRLLSPYLYYGLTAVVALVFFYVYGKKQRKSRNELWQGIEGDGAEATKEK